MAEDRKTGLVVEKDGTVRLGPRVMPPAAEVSDASRAFLATPPWGEASPPPSDLPLWAMREATDQMMKQLSDAAAQAVASDAAVQIRLMVTGLSRKGPCPSCMRGAEAAVRARMVSGRSGA